MKGPYIPIYGFGAITILVFTLPFQDNPVSVYFAGLAAATLLEYVTGTAMEALFKVRYWDYSKKKFNLKGRICLESSIMWGIMSLLMVYIIHEPISVVVLSIHKTLESVLALTVTALFCTDFGYSFKTAYDLRTMIMNNRKLMKELLIAQIRLEALEAEIHEKEMEATEKLANAQKLATQRFNEYKSNGVLTLENMVGVIKKGVDNISTELSENRSEINDRILSSRERIRAELNEMTIKIRIASEKRKTEYTKGIQSLLRRNPSAVSKRYSGVVEELRDHIEQLSIPRRLTQYINKKLNK